MRVWGFASIWCWMTGGHRRGYDFGVPVCTKCGMTLG